MKVIPILLATVFILSIYFNVGAQDQRGKIRMDIDVHQIRINHEKDYFHRPGLSALPGIEKLTDHSNSLGFETTLSYRIVPMIRLSAGLGYQKTLIRGLVALDQGRLPVDRRSFTYELVISRKTTYHIAQLPLRIQFAPLSKHLISPEATIGLNGNYYFKGEYTSALFPKYNGPVPRNHFVGWTIVTGLDTYIKVTKKMLIKVGYEYALKNPAYKDDLLGRQDFDGDGVGDSDIPLTHTYRLFKVGVSRILK